jgi:ribose-phosphate pyrophosphokinase
MYACLMLLRPGVIFLCTLDRPDEKILTLLFAAAIARELGAARIGLLAPYLAYMRQDRWFKRGGQ